MHRVARLELQVRVTVAFAQAGWRSRRPQCSRGVLSGIIVVSVATETTFLGVSCAQRFTADNPRFPERVYCLLVLLQ